MSIIRGIIPSEVLNNGTKMPVLGLSSLGWSDVPGATTQAVKDGIDLGYRYIDTTPVGTNEKEVGEAIGAKIKEGVVKREELYLVGKLWDTRAFHNPALIDEVLLTTLRNLNVAYIDMYIINCPEGIVFADEGFVDTWNAMENLVDKFLVKSIGLSQFSEEQIHHLLIAARVYPVTNQIENNPYHTQKALTEFCKQKRIVVTASGIFGSKDLIEDPLIMAMAKKYKRTPEQILLRYQVDKGHISIPEVNDKSALISNLDIFMFELNESDIADMDKLDRNKQYI